MKIKGDMGARSVTRGTMVCSERRAWERSLRAWYVSLESGFKIVESRE